MEILWKPNVVLSLKRDFSNSLHSIYWYDLHGVLGFVIHAIFLYICRRFPLRCLSRCPARYHRFSLTSLPLRWLPSLWVNWLPVWPLWSKETPTNLTERHSPHSLTKRWDYDVVYSQKHYIITLLYPLFII